MPWDASIGSVRSPTVKHSTIISRLCQALTQGYGLNETLTSLGLTTEQLARRIRRSDRVKLHQAHQTYVESLQRDLVNRARLGRKTGQLERALDNLPPLSLPGDDEDEAREYRKWRRRNFEDDAEEVIPHNGYYNYLPETLSQIREGDVEDDEDDDATAAEAPAAPRRRLQTNETPFAALSSRPPPEDATQRRPEPEPAESTLRWFRLYTGRAQLRDEDGKVIRTVTPGQSGYPSASEFVNWN